MSLSEFTRKYVETKLTAYCNIRIPENIRDKIKMVFKISGNKLTLFESRPFSADPSVWTQSPVAQFRFDERSMKWTLYSADRNSKWHIYPGIKPTAILEYLLQEVDNDPTHVFYV
jgi:hypothetical protein